MLRLPKSTESDAKKRVAVIYHFFPHYRIPVIKALSRSRRYAFEFWGAHEGVEGIKCFAGDDEVSVNRLDTISKRPGHFRMSGYWKPVLSRQTQAVIVLGNPNIIATWLIAGTARAMGKAVFFWAHGWLKKEAKFRSLIRNAYFRLAHRTLVYGDRARELAEAAGIPRGKVLPIYNSLDWDSSVPLYEALHSEERNRLKSSVTVWPDLPLLVCTARLIQACRFDQLLKAMHILELQGFPTSLNLIGDGPERENLERLARDLCVKVKFLGAIYEEQQLARYIYSADATVSPGKVGLTAMHSLTYGTPVITHGDLSEQMPEVEAIIDGVTGAFFKRGDVNDLAQTIKTWLSAKRERATTQARCREIIGLRYNPEAQRKLIELALDSHFNASD